MSSGTSSNRSYAARSRKQPSTKALQVSKLSDQDLRSLIAAVASHQRRVAEREQERWAIVKENEAIQRENRARVEEYERPSRIRAAWERENTEPLERERRQIESELEKRAKAFRSSIGLFRKPSIKFRNEDLDPSAKPLVDRWTELGRLRKLALENSPKIPQSGTQQLKSIPPSHQPLPKKIKVSGTEVLIDPSAYDLPSLESELGARKQRKIDEKEKIKLERDQYRKREIELRAKAAKNVKERRKEARRVPSEFVRQTSLLSTCPYCAGELAFESAHLDHIYPVSKGGLSTAGNMVFVCVDCNAKKRDLTLRRFLISYGFDEHYVREALDLLGKDH